MAIIRTYKTKTNYFAGDKILLTDNEPHPSTGVVTGDTANMTMATLKTIASKTYDLSVPSNGVLTLVGDDNTTDTISFSGSGGIAIQNLAANNINIDGSGITAGVASVAGVNPAASTGNAIVVNPTSGNVGIKPMAYAGGTNVGHVPTGGSANHFLGGDGIWQTMKEAHQMSPIMMFNNNITNNSVFNSQVLLVQDTWTGGRYVPLSMSLFTPSNYDTSNPGATGFGIYRGKLTDAPNATIISATVKVERVAVGMHKVSLTDLGNGVLVPGDPFVIAFYLQGDGGNLATYAGTAASNNTSVVALSATGASWPSSGTSFPTLEAILQLGSVTAPRVAPVGSIYYE
jgi:hypothetical protein